MTDAQKDHNRLVRNLGLVEGGRTSREMAAILNVSPPTYCKKEKVPGAADVCGDQGAMQERKS